LHPARVLPAVGSDSDLFMWTLAWDAHAFVHQPLSIFDANIFFPNRGTLAYSENLIGSAFFAAPILWLTGNPVLAFNVISLLSCVLCGLGAYVLGRRVGQRAEVGENVDTHWRNAQLDDEIGVQQSLDRDVTRCWPSEEVRQGLDETLSIGAGRSDEQIKVLGGPWPRVKSKGVRSSNEVAHFPSV